MPLSITELKEKWESEYTEYRTQEVGSGSQKFVKDVLESNDLFKLRQGKLSTDIQQRKNEFTEETRAKQGRQADVVIYIDSDIVIPVEIEKYGNIRAGEEQLKKYQTDFEKQYGILTDGHEWRFYNNNLYRTYALSEILGKPELFITFWRNYILPLGYYINFFEPPGQQKLFNKAEDLPVENNRPLFFGDITKLIGTLANKFNVAGYLTSIDQEIRDKKAVELTYAYVIQFVLYKTLVDNEFDDFKEEFSDRVEGIKDSLNAQHFKEALSIIQGISDQISSNIYRPFAKEQEIISETLKQILGAAKNTLDQIAPWLDIFVFIKKYDFANVKNDIFGYIYENYLKDLYEDEKKGQYFTDPAVVDFMLNQVGYTTEEIKKRYADDTSSISVIDPSCGSGTFLYSATHRISEAFSDNSEDSAKLIEDIVNKNVFGLDIEEFPLYLAEMSILMRLMPYVINEKYNNPIDKKIKVFWTKDSLAEFQNTALRNTLADHSTSFQKAAGQVDLFRKKIDFDYKSYVREESDVEEMKKSLEDQLGKNRFRYDYVVGNPPYIGYNASSKLGILFFQWLKERRVQLNDVYGCNLHSVPGRPKSYRPNPNLYAFFIALGLALLKDGGKLCYIIPQTLLTAGDLDVLRYHLAKFTVMEKIIIPDSKMFIGRGIKQKRPVPTSSLIIILRRAIPSTGHQVEVLHHADSSVDLESCLDNLGSSKGIRTQAVQQKELEHHFLNWNYLKQSKEFLAFYNKYTKYNEDFVRYYNHKLAKHFFNSSFIFDSGYDIDERQVLPIPDPNLDNYEYIALGRGYTINESRGFWPNNRESSEKNFIKLRQANQGYRLLDSKYKLIWSYANTKKFYITTKPVIWARNQYCAIGSDNWFELLYLFGILNSKVTRAVINSLLMNENEKDLLLSTTSVKEFIKLPLATKNNAQLKKVLINKTEKLLQAESMVLNHAVNFQNIIQQKFDSVEVENNKLLLTRDKKEIQMPIRGKSEIVQNAIQSTKLNGEITLSRLKNLPLVELEKEKAIKEEIDELVYQLYNLTHDEIKLVEKGT